MEELEFQPALKRLKIQPGSGGKNQRAHLTLQFSIWAAG